jgi:hypothetical protein
MDPLKRGTAREAPILRNQCRKGYKPVARKCRRQDLNLHPSLEGLGPEPDACQWHLQGSERAIPRKSSICRPNRREPHGIYTVTKGWSRGKCWRNSGGIETR